MPTTAVEVAVAVICHRLNEHNEHIDTQNADDLRFLLGYRHAKQDQGNCHEFVGGKIEPCENATDALIREVKEEIGLDIRQNRLVKLGQIEHDYPNKSVRLHVYQVHLTAVQYHKFNHSVEQKTALGKSMLMGKQGQPLIWVKLQDLLNERYHLPDANIQILQWLKA